MVKLANIETRGGFGYASFGDGSNNKQSAKGEDVITDDNGRPIVEGFTCHCPVGLYLGGGFIIGVVVVAMLWRLFGSKRREEESRKVYNLKEKNKTLQEQVIIERRNVKLKEQEREELIEEFRQERLEWWKDKRPIELDRDLWLRRYNEIQNDFERLLEEHGKLGRAHYAIMTWIEENVGRLQWVTKWAERQKGEVDFRTILIERLHRQGCTKRQIELRVFGYDGGQAHKIVSETLEKIERDGYEEHEKARFPLVQVAPSTPLRRRYDENTMFYGSFQHGK